MNKSIAMPKLLLILSLLVFLTSCDRAEDTNETSTPALKISVYGGSNCGGHCRFLQDLDRAMGEDIEIEHIPTVGAQENVNKLIGEELEEDEEKATYAIVPGDVYTDTLRNDIKADDAIRVVVPLFNAYMQVLIRKEDQDEMNSIENFRDRRISYGGSLSGAYGNAKEILGLAGLIPDENYTERSISSTAGIGLLRSTKLDDGVENGVDIIFVVGSYRDSNVLGDDLVHFSLPEVFLNYLANEKPYYSLSEIPNGSAASEQSFYSLGEIENGITALALPTYLVTTEDKGTDEVSDLVSKLQSKWLTLQLRRPDALPFDQELTYKPVKYHAGSWAVFQEAEYLPDGPGVGTMMIVALVQISLFYLLTRLRSTYNRLGTISSRISPRQKILDYIVHIGWPITIIAIVILTTATLVWVVQAVEDSYAISESLDNRLAHTPFFDAILWLFTFVVSGYPQDTLFPSSYFGALLLAFSSLLGLLLPLILVYGIFLLVSDYLKKKRSGELSYHNSKNHVVICGWNSRVPRIIYTLTGSDAPVKKQVIVVANPKEQDPLEKYGFTKKVRFCRGEPSNRTTLERAGVEQAAHIIVVPSSSKRDKANLDSALACISTRSLNQDAWITVELEYKNNSEYFESAGVNIVVDPELIAQRLLVLASVNDLISDFVLDVITFDKFGEWYSESLEKLSKISGWKINKFPISAEEVFDRSRALGTHAVGVVSSVVESSGVLDATFIDDSHLNAMLSKNDMSQELIASDSLILAANDYSQITKPSQVSGEHHVFGINTLDVIDSVDGEDVIIVGPSLRSEPLKQALVSKFNIREVIIIDSENDQESINSTLRKLLSDRSVACLYFLGFRDLHSVAKSNLAFRRDAENIVRAKLARSSFNSTEGFPKIIAEMNLIENRKNFVDAGIDIIIPYTLISERLLTNAVYGKGNVPDFLLALLTTDDRIGILQHIVTSSSPLLGKLRVDVLGQMIGDVRVVGLLPKSDKTHLQVREDYFGTHFVLCGREENSKRIGLDDIVLVISECVGSTKPIPK